jgi:Helix-turn-helix
LGAAMTEHLIRSAADWAEIFRRRIAELGLSHLDVDQIAGLADGYCNKILNAKKRPGAKTIARLCDALALGFSPVVDVEREAIMREQWEKRRR